MAKTLTETKLKKKKETKTGLQRPSGKSGVTKKGPVTPNRSRATTSSLSVSPGSQQEPSKKPGRGAGKKNTEEEPLGQFLPQLEGEAKVQRFLLSLIEDMRKVS